MEPSSTPPWRVLETPPSDVAGRSVNDAAAWEASSVVAKGRGGYRRCGRVRRPCRRRGRQRQWRRASASTAGRRCRASRPPPISVRRVGLRGARPSAARSSSRSSAPSRRPVSIDCRPAPASRTCSSERAATDRASMWRVPNRSSTSLPRSRTASTSACRRGMTPAIESDFAPRGPSKHDEDRPGRHQYGDADASSRRCRASARRRPRRSSRRGRKRGSARSRSCGRAASSGRRRSRSFARS